MTVPDKMKEEIMSNCDFPGLPLLHSPWVELELGLLGQGSHIPLIRLRVYKHTRDQLLALHGGTGVCLALAALKYSTSLGLITHVSPHAISSPSLKLSFKFINMCFLGYTGQLLCSRKGHLKH